MTPGPKRGAKDTPAKFWALVRVGAAGECWPWAGLLTTNGYGSIWWQGKLRRAHRIAYALAKDTNIPPSAIHILHKCDNPICCNPGHLFEGDQQANMKDCRAKDRFNRKARHIGESHPRAKLTEANVISARALRASGATTRELAKMYGVSKTTMEHALNGTTWRHLNGPVV